VRRQPPAAAAFLKTFRKQLLLVDPELPPKPVCRDRDDDPVLATAAGANATSIVTGDDDLLVPGNDSVNC
jgi:putative PIN family toxin of toxin-antitoxin system